MSICIKVINNNYNFSNFSIYNFSIYFLRKKIIFNIIRNNEIFYFGVDLLKLFYSFYIMDSEKFIMDFSNGF